MGIQAFYLLLPATLIGSLGVMYWFLLLVPFGLYKFFGALFSEDWGSIDLSASGAFLGITGFFIAAGCGLLAAWWLLISGYSEKHLKDIPRFIWISLLLGIVAAIVFGAITHFPFESDRVSDRLNNIPAWDRLAGESMFGFGPLISSLLAIVWHFYNEKVLVNKR